MKSKLLSILFIASVGCLSAQTSVEQANTAYTAKDYPKAVDLYQQSLQENGISATVYYNLGNTYFRMNKIAPAILNYERALLLDPGNKDIRHNLAFAQSKTVDKIEPIGEFFLTTAYNAVKNVYSANQWSRIAITCFILFIAALFSFFFTRKILWKKMGFYAGLGFFAGCLLANIFAYNQKKVLTHRNTSVIFAPTVTIKSTPDDSGTDLFILHEGTTVEVTNHLGNWTEIETADGNVGWIKKSDIEII
jgi:tetratricopeptide (TPR) repeat protein